MKRIVVAHNIRRSLPALIEQMTSAHGAEFTPSSSTSDRGNEFAFDGIRDGEVVARIRCFLFHDDGDLVALVGRDASVPAASPSAAEHAVAIRDGA